MMKQARAHTFIMYGNAHPHFFEHGSQFGSERENQLLCFPTKSVSLQKDVAKIRKKTQNEEFFFLFLRFFVFHTARRTPTVLLL